MLSPVLSPARAIVACLTLLPLTAHGADGKPAAPPASPSHVKAPAEADLLQLTPATLDYGEMIADKPKSATIKVTNVSGGPLSVKSIGGSCGCTTVTGAPTGEVAAGASFDIQVTVKPKLKTNVKVNVPVYFALESVAGSTFTGVRAQTLPVTGFVKTIVQVAPENIDLTAIPSGSNAVVTLESVDKGAFRVLEVQPAGIVDLPKEAASSHRLAIDLGRWDAAGSPVSLIVLTDKPDAEKLVVLVKAPPKVVLYRLPAAPASATNHRELEAAQDEIIRAIDERLGKNTHSSDFNMRLHRETGMLFVHGTTRDADLLRNAVKALPAGTEIREATQANASGE